MFTRKVNLRKTLGGVPVRFLNLLEHQSKNLLKKHGVAVQEFVLMEKGKSGANLDSLKGSKFVVKAQILAGGRGKGQFTNGFKGGVHIANSKKEVEEFAKKMLGHKLITKQTPKGGIEVKSVMITDFANITRETYLCFLLDRQKDGPVLIASPKGGMDIENVAKSNPELMKYVTLNYEKPFDDKTSKDVAKFIGFRGKALDSAAVELQRLFECFKKVDATQIEINPFVETKEGQVLSIDAKLSFDDNASFRQKEIFGYQDTSETDPRELEASKYDLNYIGMDGNIGCLVNGAGLAMATMDIIKLHGGDPANFLDCGGTVTEERVSAAIRIITSDHRVKAILVNIFGGIVDCAVIAKGIVSALKSTKLTVPLIVRLAGNNAEEAKNVIEKSGLNIIAASSLEDAAQKAVKSIK